MAKELKNIKLNEVSIVDKAANKRKFLFFKARGEGRGNGGAAQADGGAKYCVCPDCGYSKLHSKIGEGKSVPCAKIKCPKCGTLMEGSVTKSKKNINIEIESDGTAGGTKVTINGGKVDSLRSFSFDFWQGEDAKSKVSCSYSKLVESEGGFQRTETYYLTKGDHLMDDQIKELLKMYFGEEDKSFEKRFTVGAGDMEKVLKTIGEYKADFPEDLDKAIDILAKATIWSLGDKQEENQEDLEKAGAKLSKDTISKLKAIIAAAEALLPKEAGDNDSTKKSDDNTSDEKEKTIKALSESIAEITDKLEKKETSEQLSEISKALEQLTERLKVVENKPASKKKGLSESDSEKTRKTKSAGDDDFQWTSLVGNADDEE